MQRVAELIGVVLADTDLDPARWCNERDGRRRPIRRIEVAQRELHAVQPRIRDSDPLHCVFAFRWERYDWGLIHAGAPLPSIDAWIDANDAANNAWLRRFAVELQPQIAAWVS
jgi:hypothetical protein